MDALREQDLMAKLERARKAKMEAIENQDFEGAARWRTLEKDLLEMLGTPEPESEHMSAEQLQYSQERAKYWAFIANELNGKYERNRR